MFRSLFTIMLIVIKADFFKTIEFFLKIRYTIPVSVTTY